MTNNEDENLGSFYMGKMRPPPEPERVLPRGLLTGVIVLAFVAVLWWAYPQGQEKYTDMDVPVVQADTSPYKSAPEDPGGMEVRHQDSTIFDPMEKKGDTVEKLMPAPEQPVDKAEVLGKEPPVLDSKKPELNLEMQWDAVVAPVPTPASPQRRNGWTTAPGPNATGRPSGARSFGWASVSPATWTASARQPPPDVLSGPTTSSRSWRRSWTGRSSQRNQGPS